MKKWFQILLLFFIVVVLSYTNVKADGGAGLDSGQSCQSSEVCDAIDGQYYGDRYDPCSSEWMCCDNKTDSNRGCKQG